MSVDRDVRNQRRRTQETPRLLSWGRGTADHPGHQEPTHQQTQPAGKATWSKKREENLQHQPGEDTSFSSRTWCEPVAT